MNETGFGTHRNPSDCSVLTHSLNMVYAVRFAHPNSAFGTSHTPRMLSEIVAEGVAVEEIWLQDCTKIKGDSNGD